MANDSRPVGLIQAVASLVLAMGGGATVAVTLAPPHEKSALFGFIMLVVGVLSWLVGFMLARFIHAREDATRLVIIGSAVTIVLFVAIGVFYVDLEGRYTEPFDGEQHLVGPLHVDCLNDAGEAYLKRHPDADVLALLQASAGRTTDVWKRDCLDARSRELWASFLILYALALTAVVFAAFMLPIEIGQSPAETEDQDPGPAQR